MAYTEKYKRILSRMGYYGYQQGLIVRHMNQEEGWSTHLENCRRLIMKGVEYYNPARMTILGSGWLLDIPLAELLEKKISVRLVDIVHPPDVVRQLSGVENVELVEMDVTGGVIEETWRKTGRPAFSSKKKDIRDLLVPNPILGFDPGMIVSLNLVSQLDVLPVKLIERQTSAGKEEILSFRKKIQNKHIDLITGHPSVLITDVSEEFTFSSGRKELKETVVAEIPRGMYREEWEWSFDLIKSDYHDRNSILNVIGIIL